MKNASEIKERKVNEIMDLFKFVNCFEYSRYGVESMVNAWADAKDKMITDIAEKSEYYNGDCKIVFPSDYKRGIDSPAIYKFIDWLKIWYSSRQEEAEINGMTYEESDCMRRLFRNMRDNFNVPTVGKFFENYDSFNTMKGILNDEDMLQQIDDAYREFERCDTTMWLYDNRRYFKSSSNLAMVNVVNFLWNNYNHQELLDERMANELKQTFPLCRFQAGQKTSRAIQKVCLKYGIGDADDHEWRSHYSDLSNALNPLTVKRWTVISWDPVDFLTMSFGDNWSSCFTIDKRNKRNEGDISDSYSRNTNYVNSDYHFGGSGCANTVRLMLDSSTFVYYTINENYEGDEYQKQDKVTRQLFHLSYDYTTLIQNRLYPQKYDDMGAEHYAQIREIVQRIISDSTDCPNLWIKKDRDVARDCTRVYGYVELDHMHYDYDYDKCNISYLNSKGEPSTVHIGEHCMCPNCGEGTDDNNSTLNCCDCC